MLSLKSDGFFEAMRELPKHFGDESEGLATRFLEQEGFIILERNYFARKLGEIDIIAQKEDVLHFIEVKSGKSDSFDPVYNVTPAKLRKVINSSHYYMKSKKLDLSFSIDALIIRYDEVEFIENVTL
jgi:putative endonuclease